MNELMKKRYLQQRAQARMRNIGWNITFEEWATLWISSGKWEFRGTKKDQYVMSRIGDIGPYQLDNVFIQLSGKNVKDAHVGSQHSTQTKEKMKISRVGKTHSDETKEKISLSKKGKPSPNKNKRGQIAWNKGLTKHSDPRIQKYGETRTTNKLIKENQLCV